MKPLFTAKIPGYMVGQSNTLPDEHIRHYLPGSDILTAAGTFGKISVQQFSLEAFHIYYVALTIEQAVSINLYCSVPLCFSQVVLAQSYEAVIQGIGNIRFKQHAFSVLYMSRLNSCCSFAKGQYLLLVITYPPAILLPVLAYFPGLEALQNRIEKNQPAFLQHTAHPLSAQLTQLVYQLLQVPFIASTRQFHLRNIRSIITVMCAQLNATGTGEPFFSQDDMAVIHATKDFIDAHLDTHYTISQLARKMGINEHKLKKGFKAVTGVGLFGYLLRQRLAIAKAQLEQSNKPVGAIARKAGYRSTANFCIAFRKQYGITPHQFQKQYKR
ncbi:AraC family transcriptional regulator [Ilyomonas limi]|nr:helix-turn-helix domain-containing protein [Ilyomonas limi]